MPHPQLGLGLISIGRTWGHAPVPVPNAGEAARFLDSAYALGLRCFDTSPSYGDSEVKLGRFVRALDRESRGLTVVATKFGEHWDDASGAPFVDHSFDALCRSLDRSLERLGSIDLLQLHRATPEALHSADLAKAWIYALQAGVKNIGASTSDPASAQAALELGYGVLQMPYNRAREDMAGAFHRAAGHGVELLINRPYQAGSLLYGERPPAQSELFAHILRTPFEGWVLTGTRSIDHLKENLAAFETALAEVDKA